MKLNFIYLNNSFFFSSKLEASKLYFQFSCSPNIDGIAALHDFIILISNCVLIVVMGSIIYILFYFHFKNYQTIENKQILDSRRAIFFNNRVTHNINFEIAWTLIPTFILIFIAVPSFSLLYAIDEIISAYFVSKTIGHQWYWSYQIISSFF